MNERIMNSIIKKYNYDLGYKYQKLSQNQGSQMTGKQGYFKLGLEKIAKDLNRLSKGRSKELKEIVAPEKKLVVMIVGNHSAGKSSFINWYIEQEIQKTKVSIETIEINIIMQGSQMAEFNSHNAMQMLPFLKDLYDQDTKLEKFNGLLENLFIKSCNSQAKDFSNIIFIDTPGLADGDLKYKFDIDNTLDWFAKHCDMILVFLDPNGQALCKRTNTLISKLHEQNQSKLHFVMTKGDIFENQDDRMKCMCQITQGLATALPPMHGFQMLMISIPNASRNKTDKSSQSINQINDLVSLFKKKIQVKVQSNLSRFSHDLKTIENGIVRLKQEQKKLREQNKWADILLQFVNLVQIICLVLCFISLIDFFSHDYINERYQAIEANKSVFHLVFKLILGLASIINLISDKFMIHDYSLLILISTLALTPLLFILQKAIPERFMLISERITQMLENYHLFIMQTKRKYKSLATKLNEKTFLQIAGNNSNRNLLHTESDIGNDPLGNTSYDESSMLSESKNNCYERDILKSDQFFESDEDQKSRESKKFK